MMFVTNVSALPLEAIFSGSSVYRSDPKVRHSRHWTQSVTRKPAHRDRYLHRDFKNHPGYKRAVMKTLIDRGLRICKPHILGDELKHLDIVLQANGYSVAEIRRAMRRRTPHRSTNSEDQTEDVYKRQLLAC